MPNIVILPPGESIHLQPTSPAFAHGFGLFETMCYADGRLYFWPEHWQRLAKSAQHFGLALPPQDAVFVALRKLVTSSRLEQAILKISLLKAGVDTRLCVYSRPPIPAPEVRCLRLATEYPIFARSLMAGHKTHNYMEAIYLLQQARQQGYYDYLRVDSNGMLAETTSANVFIIKGKRIFTPSLTTGILPGVTRAALLSLPELAVEEGEFAPESLLEADAVLVTNATSGLQAIERIEGFPGQQAVNFQQTGEILVPLRKAFVQKQLEQAVQLI